MGEGLDVFALVLAFVAITFAATVKAAIGFGLPLISVPILANILDTRTAVLVMTVPALASNVVMIWACRGSRELIRRLIAVLGFLIVGTILGAQVLATLDIRTLSLVVGLVSVGFVALQVFRVRLVVPTKQERVLSPMIGLFSGVLGGATNIFGPVLAAYLHTLTLRKADFLFAMTLMFLVGNGTQVLSYYRLGLFADRILLLSLFACLPVMVGVFLGLKLQNRLSPRVWSGAVMAAIFASGLNLLVRGLLA